MPGVATETMPRTFTTKEKLAWCAVGLSALLLGYVFLFPAAFILLGADYLDGMPQPLLDALEVFLVPLNWLDANFGLYHHYIEWLYGQV